MCKQKAQQQVWCNRNMKSANTTQQRRRLLASLLLLLLTFCKTSLAFHVRCSPTNVRLTKVTYNMHVLRGGTDSETTYSTQYIEFIELSLGWKRLWDSWAEANEDIRDKMKCGYDDDSKHISPSDKIVELIRKLVVKRFQDQWIRRPRGLGQSDNHGNLWYCFHPTCHEKTYVKKGDLVKTTTSNFQLPVSENGGSCLLESVNPSRPRAVVKRKYDEGDCELAWQQQTEVGLPWHP